MKEQNKFVYFNILRFVGAIIIAIFLHYNDHFIYHLGANSTFVNNRVLYYISTNSYVFVEMFFMISGILFSRVYIDKIIHGEKINEFIIKRYKRIFPLVIISTLFIYIETLLYHEKFLIFYSCGTLSLRELIFDLLFSGTVIFGTGVNPLNGPLWYIGVLFICYIIAYLLTLNYKKYNSYFIYTIPLFIGISILLTNYNVFIFNPNVARGLISFFVGILLGNSALLGKIDKLTSKQKIKFRISMALIVIIFMLAIFGKHSTLFINSYYDNILCYIFLFFVPLILLLYDVNWLNKICNTKIVKYLGNISYSIYVWNFPILIFLTYIIKSGWLNINVESNLCIYILFIIHIVIGTVSYYFIEKRFNKN